VNLYSYLEGPKGYRAGGELGFETTTLDMEGNVTKTAPFDHVTREALESVVPSFTGRIQQIPPIFSAIRKEGKQLYKEARAGKSVDDIEIEPREVHVLSLDVLGFDLPKFDVQVQCGGGTYIRSLIRDIGYKLDSVATTTFLERTQQGQFKLDDPGILPKDDWTADKIYAAIDRCNAARQEA
jgi:tRNA pseudouridine55 synthase